MHKLCRWAIPVALAGGAIAIWVAPSPSVVLAIVGILLVACPVACVVVLLWESHRCEQAVARTAERQT